jgi:hypothetical protein
VYLVNYLSLQAAQQLFISVARYRTEVTPLGLLDQSNQVFTVPFGDKFLQNVPFFAIEVYYNGVLQTLLWDYTVSESGGSGTGFDTITLAYAPYSNDSLVVNYIVA